MRSRDHGTHGGTARRADDLGHGNLYVRKGRDDFPDQRLRTLATGLLMRRERNVLPVGRDGFVEQVRIALVEGPIQGL
jgi:hypothetical protein